MPQISPKVRHNVVSSRKLHLTKRIVLSPPKIFLNLDDRCRALIENMNLPAWMGDRNSKGIYANDAFYKLSGYSPNDIIGKIFYNFFTKESAYRIHQIEQTDRKLGISSSYEVDLIAKSGELIPLLVSGTPFSDGGSVGILQDLRPIRQKEQELRASENTYRAIFENTGTATMIVEENEFISFVNAQFLNMSGFSKEDILNEKKWFDFFAEEDMKMMKNFHTMRRINPYSAPRNYEARFVTKDGEERNVFLTTALIPGTKKSVTSILDITARKIVENELKASKKLFDDLVQGSPIPLYMIDTNHKVVYWNKAMEVMSGFKANQIIGTSNHWKPFYKEPTRQISDMIIDGVKWQDILKIERYKDMHIEEANVKTGIVCSKWFEDFHNGKKKWQRFKIRLLYDLQNKLVGAIETIEDITELKNLSDYLANRMREFQALYQSNSHIRMVLPLNKVFRVIVKDLSLACDVIEPARARIVFDGKVYSNLKKNEKFISKINESIIINGIKRGYIELGYIEKIDNKESFSLMHEKKIVRIIAQTIGKHVQSREILERYKKLVNKSVTGIFILYEGKFQYVNPKFIRMFKFTKEDEIIGTSFENLLPDCECPKKLIVEKNLNSAQCNVKAKRKDGSLIDVEIFTQIIDYYGKRAILGTIQDVTKIKEAQERQRNFSEELKEKIAEKTKDLQKANRRLQSLNELKDEFIAVTSHELRSPLTAARGYLSFLIDEKILNNIPQEAKDYLIHVYDNVEVLNNLVNNILDVSRMEMGRFELHKISIDILNLIKQVINNLSFQANEKKVSINFINKTEMESLILNIDEVRIRQVIRNILDNAIKYSPYGKDINVEIQIRGIGVQISVIDQGMGIRKSEIFDIFDKFKQGSNSLSQYKGGAGLGLFIAKKIMELHNGMIWAESELRRGTTFHMQLPLE